MRRVHERLQLDTVERTTELGPVEDDSEDALPAHRFHSSLSDFHPPRQWQEPGAVAFGLVRAPRPTPITWPSDTPPRRTTNWCCTVGFTTSGRTNPSSAQLLAKVYVGSLDEAGAKKVAQEFAADILKIFGAASLMGTKIYFVSDRTGHKEIWSMNYDGSDQKQFTSYRSITTFPVASADGTKIAFTTYPMRPASPGHPATEGQPRIYIHSLETGRKLVYLNQEASMNAASDFMPDNRHLLIYSTAAGGVSQIFMTDIDGGGFHRITNTRSLEVEAKANPKTGADIVFTSGRGGTPQIYRMSIDGTDVAPPDYWGRGRGQPGLEPGWPAHRVCVDAWI